MTGEYSTLTSLVAAFMVASSTPGTALSASSIFTTHSAQYKPLIFKRMVWPLAAKPAPRTASSRSATVTRDGSYSTKTRPSFTLAVALLTPDNARMARSSAGPPDFWSPPTGSAMRTGPFASGATPVVADEQPRRNDADLHRIFRRR